MKKIFFSTLVLSLVLLAVFLKPISIYILESSLSSLLETPVKTLQFDLLSLDLHATIKDEKNIAHVKINHLYPLQADVTYEGNIDAFKVYHPLKAHGKLTGTVYYKDYLDIHAQLLCMQAVSTVHVLQNKDDWVVDANVSALDLTTLQKDNKIPLKLEGKVDILVDFHTAKDSSIEVSSKQVKLQGEKYNDVLFKIKEVKDLIQAYAIFKAPNIAYKGIWFNYHEDTKHFDGEIDLLIKKANNNILIKLEGEHNNSKLIAKVDANIALSKIDITDIKYDFNTSKASANVQLRLKEVQRHKGALRELGIDLQGDFDANANLRYEDKKLFAQMQTQSLGGSLKVLFENDTLSWKASSVSLQKILYILKKEEDLVSFIDSEGSLKGQNIKAELQTKYLQVGETKIEDLRLQTLGRINDLNLSLQAKSVYANVEKAFVHVKDFKDINISAEISTPYTKELIHLNSQVLYENAQVHLGLNAKSKEFNLKVLKTSYKDDALKGKYALNVYPRLSNLKNRVHVDGSFSYIKDFNLLAYSKDFGGKLKFELKGDNIRLKANKIKVQKLLSELKLAPYASGNVNFYLQGDFQKQSFSFLSHTLHMNKKETGLDENISCLIKGNINENRIYVQPDIKNRYLQTSKGDISFVFEDKELFVNLPMNVKKQEHRVKLLLETRLNMQNGIKGELGVFSEDDSLKLQDFRYVNESLKTKLNLKIDDLSLYSGLIDEEFYGPLDLNGKIKYANKKPNVELQTQSLGGSLTLRLKNKDLNVSLEQLHAAKIGRLFKKQGASSQGILKGGLIYNLEKKKGNLELTAKDMKIKGIDIDKTLKEYQDILGLNIFAMGDTLVKKRFSKNDDVNLSTTVQHIEFDVQITPELIISKDIALSTAQNRFAVNASLSHNGDIKDFEVAILDLQGCAVLTQKLKGNIKEPKLVDTEGTAVVVLGKVPKQILKTGEKLVSAGAELIDSAASFVWKKGLREDSKVTLVEDIVTKGANVFSSGEDLLVRGECKVFYKGAVNAPD